MVKPSSFANALAVSQAWLRTWWARVQERRHERKRVALARRWFEDIDAMVPARSREGTLVVALGDLGDMLLERAIFPLVDGEPTVLLGNAAWRDAYEFLDSGTFGDALWMQKGRFLSDPEYRQELLRTIRDRGFSRVLCPSPSRNPTLEDVVAYASGAPVRVGWEPGIPERSRASMELSRRAYPKEISLRFAGLFEFRTFLRFAGLVCNARTEILRPVIDRKAFRSVSLPSQWLGAVVIVPGTGAGSRRWSARHFSRLMDALAEEFPDEKFVVAGAPHERALGQEVVERCRRARPLLLCGETRLPQYMALVASARLVVSGDSSAAHIAAMTGTQAIALCNGSNHPRFMGHTASNLHVLMTPAFRCMATSPGRVRAFLRKPLRTDVNTISVEEVMAVARKILSGVASPVNHGVETLESEGLSSKSL